MKSFWNFLLKKSLPSNSLSAAYHCIFGLGDSAYTKYNAAARKLNARLAQLGSAEFASIGLGDDQASLSYLGAYDLWMEDLQIHLLQAFPLSLPTGSSSEFSDAECAGYTVEVVEALVGDGYMVDSYSPPPLSRLPLLQTTVMTNTRLTASDWSQDVRHISLAIPPDCFNSSSRSNCSSSSSSSGNSVYTAGDVAVIHPKNSSDQLKRVAALFQKGRILLSRGDSVVRDEAELWGTSIRISRRSSSHAVRRSRAAPTVCTVRFLVENLLDLAGRPRRSFLRLLAQYAFADEEQAKLQELGSAAGADLFHEYVVQERRSFTEVLEDFSSVRIPLDVLVALVPVLQPRPYSIACDSSLFPDQMHLCVAVAVSRTRYGRRVAGVCSSYLASLKDGDTVSLSIRRGLYSAHESLTDPLRLPPMILVGPGTGVAPVRAIVQQHLYHLVAHGSDCKLLVFFGCRRSSQDFLYNEEWPRVCDFLRQWRTTSKSSLSAASAVCELRSIYDFNSTPLVDGISSSSIMTDLVITDDRYLVFWPAFSQNQQRKIYVSDIIRCNASAVVSAMLAGASVFVSGSGKLMPVGVRKALVSIMSTIESEKNAENFISQLERRKQYIVDVW